MNVKFKDKNNLIICEYPGGRIPVIGDQVSVGVPANIEGTINRVVSGKVTNVHINYITEESFVTLDVVA